MRKFKFSEKSLYSIHKSFAKKGQRSGVPVSYMTVGRARWMGKCILVEDGTNYIRTSPIVSHRKTAKGYTVKTQNGSTYKLEKIKKIVPTGDIDGILETE